MRKSDIFRCDEDRAEFLDQLGHATKACGTSVIAYCLMGNHFHLILRCDDGKMVDTMQRLGTQYARWFNRRYDYVGPVFRSRYKSVRITGDEHLLTTSRYVHRNPIEFNLTLAEYRWSSYPSYLGAEAPAWLDTRAVLELSGSPTQYREFVETVLPSDKVAKHDGNNKTEPRPPPRPDLETIADLARRLAPKGTDARVVRDVVLVVAGDTLRVPRRRVAEWLGAGSASTARTAITRARRRQQECPEVASLVDTVVDRLPTL